MAFDSALFLTRDTCGYAGLVKEAATKLGNDPAKWEQELISAFHEQHPFLKDTQLRINIHRSDPDSGTLVGQIVVAEKAAVPVIVDRSKIQPFDLYLHEGKIRPLTKEAFLDLLQPTSIGTVAPPGTGETSDVSIFNMTQPPFAGKYSFAESLEFTVDEYEKALQQLGPQGLEYALKACHPFSKVASHYAASALEAHPAKTNEHYVVERFLVDPFVPINETGTYEVLVGGMKKVAGLVIDKLVNLRDGKEEITDKLFCSFDGKIALAEYMGGRPVEAPDVPFTDDPRKPGFGFFWMHKDGELVATPPVRLLYCGLTEEGSFLKVADYHPEGGTITVRPSEQYNGLLIRDGEVFMGKDWNWKACSPELIKVADAGTANAAIWPECVEIRHTEGAWTLHGLEDTDIARDGETTENFIIKTAALLGVDETLSLMSEAETKGSVFFLAHLNTQKAVPNSGDLKPVNLIKEAVFVTPLADAWMAKTALSVSPDEAETTVDTLLGLNFMTPENIQKFVDKSDVVEDAMGVLSKLLLASRLGMPVEASPVRTALFSLDNVMRQMQHLKSMTAGDEE